MRRALRPKASFPEGGPFVKYPLVNRFLYTGLLLLLAPLSFAGVVEFAPLRASFVSQFVSFRPESATSLGMPGFNDKLSIPTPSNIAAQIGFFETVQRDLASAHGKDAQQEIDRQVMLTVARSQLHDMKERKTYLTDVGAAQGPYDVIQSQTAQMGAKANEEWPDIAARAELVPEYLKAVRANLESGANEGRQVYRGFVEKDGIEAAESAAAYFGKELLEKAKEQLAPADFEALKPRLEAAGKKAEAAYLAHAEFLKSKILPAATSQYGIGKDEYAWKLKNELGVNETPEELQAKGRALAEKLTARMTALAKEIAPDKTLPELMAELKADHPKNDAELLAAYRESSERARDFVVKEGLFAIPEDYSINVIETPMGMRSSIGSAAYFPAPPLDPSKKGVFLVTPSAGVDARLAIHNYTKIPTTVVHEAFPGHDMQFWSFQRAEIPVVRYLLEAGYAYSLNVEGYAHYAEELMRERGFYTKKEELTQLSAQLWRAWRITLDSALHTGAMTLEEAGKILVEKAFLPVPISLVEPYRYLKMPTQALTYMLGRLQIEELKEAYKKRTGKGYSEAEFHKAFLSYGPVLPSQIGPAMLEAARPGSLLRRLWRNPAATVAASVIAAAIFNAGVFVVMGSQAAQEFLSTYLIEWTLSLDNLVVLSTVLHTLPRAIRPKVLGWGILGAVLMRLLMVTAGMSLTAAAPVLFVVFGAFLLTVAIKMLKPEWDLIGAIVDAVKTRIKAAVPARPAAKAEPKVKKGFFANPFVWGLIAVVGYDAIFALDSVPAALAISKSVFIIIAANIFSVLGLRSLFKVLDKLEERFPHLQKGVAAVLFFVAAKLILGPLAGLHIGSLVSLIVVLAALAGSMLIPARKHA